MKKKAVINFINSIKDIGEITEIYIENGISKDYIEVRYYDREDVFKSKAKVVERGK